MPREVDRFLFPKIPKTIVQPQHGNVRRHETHVDGIRRRRRRGRREFGGILSDGFRQVAQASVKRRPKVARRWAGRVGRRYGRAWQAGRASATGVWSKWQARREHDPTEGQDGVGNGGGGEGGYWRRRGQQLWLASEKSLPVRTVPRRQARRDHSDGGFMAVSSCCNLSRIFQF